MTYYKGREKFSRFYSSAAWQRSRKAYLATVHGLCEACTTQNKVSAATQVHHKIRLSETNINDVNISLNHDNLVALCDFHHQEEHGKHKTAIRRGLMFDENGDIIKDPFSNEE